MKQGDQVVLSREWFDKNNRADSKYKPVRGIVMQNNPHSMNIQVHVTESAYESVPVGEVFSPLREAYEVEVSAPVPVKYKTVQLLVAVTVRVPESHHIHDIGIGRVQLRNANKADGTAKILQAVQLRS